MKSKIRLLTTVVLSAMLALVLIGALVASSPTARAEPGAPEPGTVAGIRTFEFYPATYVSGASGTAYSSSPRYYYGQDMTYSRNWHSADVFVTADVSGTAAVTVTAQYSPDATNWTDAEFLSEGWVLPLTYESTVTNTATITNSSGVTSTTTSTSTMTTTATHSFSGSTATRSSEWVKYQTNLSTDATEFFRLPLAGEYMRFKIEYAASVTEGVTVTIKSTLRND